MVYNWKTRIFSKITEGSVRGSIFGLFVSSMSIATLTIPYAFSKMGIIPATIVYLFVGLICCGSLYTLFLAIKMFGANNYVHLVELLYGKKFGFLFEIICALFSLCNSVASISAVISMFISIYNLPYWMRFVFSVIIALIIAPILFSNNNITYKLLVVIPIVLSILIAFIMIYFEITNKNSNNSVDLFKFGYEFVYGYNIVIFTFSQHVNACIIFSLVKNPNQKRMYKICARASVFETLYCILIGLVGYTSFGNNTLGNVMDNYNNTFITIIMKYLISVCIIFSLQSTLLSISNSFDSVYYKFNLDSLFTNNNSRSQNVGLLPGNSEFFSMESNRSVDMIFSIESGNNLVNYEVDDTSNVNPRSCYTQFFLPTTDAEFFFDDGEFGSPVDSKVSRNTKIAALVLSAFFSIFEEEIYIIIGLFGGILATTISILVPSTIAYAEGDFFFKKQLRYLFIIGCSLFSFIGYASSICIIIKHWRG